jgi:hypothetical protein
MVDSCISNIFEPGAWDTDSGSVATPHYSGFLLLEESTDHIDLDALDDATPWIYVPFEGDGVTITITGTWTGTIVFDYGTGVSADSIVYTATDPFTITANGTYGPYVRLRAQWIRLRMYAYGSGVAHVFVQANFNRYFLIEQAGVAIGRLKLE